MSATTFPAEQLKLRTKRFALNAIASLRNLPKSEETNVIARQLPKSATSVAANYRAVSRSRSKPEFVARIGIVVEEADETVFWLELLSDLKLLNTAFSAPLLTEANELLAIFGASQRTAKNRALSK